MIGVASGYDTNGIILQNVDNLGIKLITIGEVYREQ